MPKKSTKFETQVNTAVDAQCNADVLPRDSQLNILETVVYEIYTRLCHMLEEPSFFAVKSLMNG